MQYRLQPVWGRVLLLVFRQCPHGNANWAVCGFHAASGVLLSSSPQLLDSRYATHKEERSRVTTLLHVLWCVCVCLCVSCVCVRNVCVVCVCVCVCVCGVSPCACLVCMLSVCVCVALICLFLSVVCV